MAACSLVGPERDRAVLVSACPLQKPFPALLCPHSPSGCTFWGKRPWSRTRRILWQLGMVLGAPMVISLAAGVAVPVITIGIPIYMGRKVLAGGSGVPVEPDSPRPWTDPLCATPDHPQHILCHPCQPTVPPFWDLLLPPAAPASPGSGVRGDKGGRVLGGLFRNSCVVVAVLLWLRRREGCLGGCDCSSARLG